MNQFYSLPYSPWSEKARFALDLYHIPYSEVEYVPMLMEPIVRFKAKNPVGPHSIPLLITPKKAIYDSLEIARYAHDQARVDLNLFPELLSSGIEKWNQISESLNRGLRSYIMNQIAQDKAASAQLLPAMIPSFLKPHLTLLGDMGMRFLRLKYQVRDFATYEEEIHHSLKKVQEALKRSPYLLGEFSYADIAIATSLQFISPVKHPKMPLGNFAKRAMTNQKLKDTYPDLLEWRDKIYQDFRDL